MFTQLFQDVYLPAAIPVTHEIRCRAAACIAPPSATITGASAAAIYGYEFAATYDPIEFIVPEEEKFTSKRDTQIRRCTLGAADGTPWHGIRLATPLRTTLDLLCNTTLRRSLPRTVGMLDTLLHTGFVRRSSVDAMLKSRHDKGIVRARTALGLANPLAESIPESELRVWLVTNGLDPESQVEVIDDDGTFLGRLDLAFSKRKVAVEYDGEWHKDPDQARYDHWRRGRMEAIGWRFVIVTREWLRDDPHAVVETVRSALQGS